MFWKRWNQEIWEQRISRALSFAKIKHHSIFLRSATSNRILLLHFILHYCQLEWKLQISAVPLPEVATALSRFCLWPHYLAQMVKKEWLSTFAWSPAPASKVGSSHFHCKMTGLSSTVWKLTNWEEEDYLDWSKNANPKWSGSSRFV